MVEEATPTKIFKCWGCPCGIVTILVMFSPQMRKIKRIEAHINFWNDVMAFEKRGCQSFLDFASMKLAMDGPNKNNIEDLRKQYSGQNCGCEWEESGITYRHCLDILIRGVEKYIPDGKESEEGGEKE